MKKYNHLFIIEFFRLLLKWLSAIRVSPKVDTIGFYRVLFIISNHAMFTIKKTEGEIWSIIVWGGDELQLPTS